MGKSREPAELHRKGMNITGDGVGRLFGKRKEDNYRMLVRKSVKNVQTKNMVEFSTLL